MKPQGYNDEQAPKSNGQVDSRNGDHSDMRMKCEEIQDLLFDYMSRELGGARSDLIHEHLRKCRECQKAAAEIEATLNLLGETSSEQTGISSSLSDERRERMERAIKHPVLDWIYVHHILTSIAVAAIAIALVSIFLSKARLWRELPEKTPTVIIGDPNGRPEQWEPGRRPVQEE